VSFGAKVITDFILVEFPTEWWRIVNVGQGLQVNARFLGFRERDVVPSQKKGQIPWQYSPMSCGADTISLHFPLFQPPFYGFPGDMTDPGYIGSGKRGFFHFFVLLDFFIFFYLFFWNKVKCYLNQPQATFYGYSMEFDISCENRLFSHNF
jgi:hypothetical protein